MVIFTGKLISGAAMDLQNRVFLMPWVKKNMFINCYSSSNPVRYIPKKSRELPTSIQPIKTSQNEEMCRISEHDELKATLSNGGKSLRGNFVLNEKSQNERPTNNLFLNGKSEVEQEIGHKCGVVEGDEFMEEPEEVVEELEWSQGKDAGEYIAFQTGVSKQDAEIMAVKLLATRAYTAVELKKKLLGKRCPHAIADAVISNFQSRGLINDCLYAETFSRSRWSSSSWGPRRIKQALSQKGVSTWDAENAIKLVFEDDESGEDEEPIHGFSKLSMDHLFVQVSKQWLRGQDLPIDTRKARLIRWLQYRGFNWGVISHVLRKLV